MKQVLILSESVITEALTNLSDWRLEDGKLMAEFTLPDFDTAIELVNKVAAVSREMDHHPLMTNVYNRLLFSLSTHGVGDRVTQLDLDLAHRISLLINEDITQ
ncbi:4a-hydroxytetrahydrobiopterin dehydratase [Candidatus Nomurabacteria bacterium]|nr:4a-hydroxytetrahydrobiopterin dehydratase [Candidatus Nomurabacteria bacterium]